jgi:hypothetical protein
MKNFTLKDYYWARGINYDKATRRLLERKDDLPTVPYVPAALNVLLPKAVPTIPPPKKDP